MTKYEKLEKELLNEKKSSWIKRDNNARTQAFGFSEEYRQFLSQVKTERENVREVVKMAEERGFLPLSELGRKGHRKYYDINQEKNLVLIVLGRKNVKEGVNLVASHVDVPHIDLKMNPLYEDEEYCLVKTHYYGGIKKYHWVNLPLALHGIIVKKDGTRVNVVYGEEESEGVLTFPDDQPSFR